MKFTNETRGYATRDERGFAARSHGGRTRDRHSVGCRDPHLSGCPEPSQDKAAQSSLRVAQTAALVIFSDDGDFGDADTAALGLAEPSFTWNNSSTASVDDQVVSVAANGGGTEWGAAAMSDSGVCFYIRVSSAGPTRYGSSSSTYCTGAQGLLVSDTSW